MGDVIDITKRLPESVHRITVRVRGGYMEVDIQSSKDTDKAREDLAYILGEISDSLYGEGGAMEPTGFFTKVKWYAMYAQEMFYEKLAEANRKPEVGLALVAVVVFVLGVAAWVYTHAASVL